MGNRSRCRLSALILLCCAAPLSFVTSFQSPIALSRYGDRMLAPQRATVTVPSRNRHQSSTSLNMFMGSDGGVLGIGTPELFTILLVGYFVLGPSDLYKIVKEIGKFIQNIRTFSTDLTTSFQDNMESQLQLDEIRKAQRELNDAFSFRRSINVDENDEAFTNKPSAEAVAEAQSVQAAAQVQAAQAAAAVEPTKKRKIRRRVRKREDPVEETVPDLQMPEPVMYTASNTRSDVAEKISEEEAAVIEQEFEKYASMTSSSLSEGSEWLDKRNDDKAPAEVEQSRFQQQLSGNWNQQVLANEESLAPLSTIMNKLALLEQEKTATLKRLEEEFERRRAVEDKYFQEQRKLLEQASREVQEAAILGPNTKVSARVGSGGSFSN